MPCLQHRSRGVCGVCCYESSTYLDSAGWGHTSPAQGSLQGGCVVGCVVCESLLSVRASGEQRGEGREMAGKGVFGRDGPGVCIHRATRPHQASRPKDLCNFIPLPFISAARVMQFFCSALRMCPVERAQTSAKQASIIRYRKKGIEAFPRTKST